MKELEKFSQFVEDNKHRLAVQASKNENGSIDLRIYKRAEDGTPLHFDLVSIPVSSFVGAE